MENNNQYTSVKGGGNFRARHDPLTDQNGYVDDSSLINALPLKYTSTDF